MNKVQIQIIKEAIDQPHLLTDWENEFVDSLADLEDDQSLTSKQNDIVNRIGHKIAQGDQ